MWKKILLLTLALGCSRKELGDIIPPAEVRDLEIKEVSYDSVILTFLAVGDDGYSGRALEYDIRYSESVTFKYTPESVWDKVRKAEIDVTPKPSGMREDIKIVGLKPKTRYYFALKVKDDGGNESRISNVKEAVTLDVPGGSGTWEYVGDVSAQRIVKVNGEVRVLLVDLRFYDLNGRIYGSPVIPIYEPEVVEIDGGFLLIGGKLENIPCTFLYNTRILKFDGSWREVDLGGIVPFGNPCEEGAFGCGIFGHRVLNAGGKIFIIGGREFTGLKCVPRSLAEICMVEEGKLKRRYMTGITSPPAISHFIAFTDGLTIYVVGGETQYIGGSGYVKSDEIFTLDVRTLRWSRFIPEGLKPGPTSRGCVALDDKNRRAIIFSDFGGKPEVIAFYFDAKSFVKMIPEGKGPSNFLECSAVYHENGVYILANSKIFRLNF